MLDVGAAMQQTFATANDGSKALMADLVTGLPVRQPFGDFGI